METGTHRTGDGLDLLTRHWTPDGPARATMLIVHGLAEHCGRWEHVAAFFTAAGYDVHSFDLAVTASRVGPGSMSTDSTTTSPTSPRS